MFPQLSKACRKHERIGATIYRASLIARVGKVPLLVLPRLASHVWENCRMNLRKIESLDNDAMNGRVAGIVSRY